MSLEKEPSLEQFEDDAEGVANGKKGVDGRDIEIAEKVDPAKEVLRDAVLGQADASRENAEATARQEEEARKLAEARAKTEEEARMAALDQKLEGAHPVIPNAKPQVATSEQSAPVETEDVAQEEIADEQREIAERSGALLAEGNDKAEK
jgi:hypothetical protein